MKFSPALGLRLPEDSDPSGEDDFNSNSSLLDQLIAPVFNVKAFGAKGDGVTDDKAAIVAADAASTAAGGSLYFPSGTFLCANLNLGSPTIRGNGSTSVLRLNNAGGATTIIASLANNACVRDLSFDLQAVALSIAIGLAPLGLSGVLVTGCRFSNGQYPIYTTSTISDLRIVDNDFQTYAGPTFNGATLDTVLIANNRLKGVTGQGGSGVNFNLGTLTKVVVADNIIDGYWTSDDATGFGIDLAGSGTAGAPTIVDVTISGNTIVNCVGDAIHIEGATRQVTVTGNTIDNCGGPAVNLVTSATTPAGVTTISGNTVTGCGTVFGTAGISVQGTGAGNSINVNGNTVRGCGRAGAAAYAGIAALGGGKIVVAANIVVDTVGTISYGIEAGNNVLVTGNRCYDDGAGTQQYGFAGAGAGSQIDLIGNNFTGNTTGDMTFLSTSSASGRSILYGVGSPAGVVPAQIGAAYLRTDGAAGTTLYLKETGAGSAGWVVLPSLTQALAQVFVGGLLSSNSTQGVGYATGAGGAAAVASGGTVVLNKVCGAITMTSTIAAGGSVTFTLTNAEIALTDVVACSVQASGTQPSPLVASARVTAAGTAIVTIQNLSATITTASAVLVNFALIKAVAA